MRIGSPVARGGRTLFTGLSFAVEGGEALLLHGPERRRQDHADPHDRRPAGAAAGRIGLEGGDAERSLGEQCHYVGHLNAVKSSLTVEENAAFWCRFLGSPDAGDRIEPALASFGLADLRDMPAAYLSAGQKRRLGLARVLLAERPIWLLDEPTVSLDRAAQDMLGVAVNAHVAAGGLVVAATHVPLGFARARELHLGSPAPPA